MRRQDSNLRPPGYEAVSRENRSHFGSDLCFLPPFTRRIFRCFRPALSAFFGFWVKSGSEALYERFAKLGIHLKGVLYSSHTHLILWDDLHFRNRVYGAAHPHHRAGPACHLPTAGDHRRGHVDVVGAFRPLVAVIGHVLCRPGLDAPTLILPGVDGCQRVLQAHAVLVQRGFGAGAGGNGEGGVHVLDAGAVVADRDIHIGVLVRQRDFDAPPDIVGAEIGDGVVGQFAEGLAEFLEVAGDAREEFSAVGGVVGLSNDGFAHNLFLLKNVF